jgi:hypothetical protein
VCFGHKLAKCEFYVTKLLRANSFIIPWRPSLVCWCSTLGFSNTNLKYYLFSIFRRCCALVQHWKRSRHEGAIRVLYVMEEELQGISRSPKMANVSPHLVSHASSTVCGKRGSRLMTRSNSCGHASSTTLLLVRWRPRQPWRHRGAGVHSSRCSPYATWATHERPISLWRLIS